MIKFEVGNVVDGTYEGQRNRRVEGYLVQENGERRMCTVTFYERPERPLPNVEIGKLYVPQVEFYPDAKRKLAIVVKAFVPVSATARAAA